MRSRDNGTEPDRQIPFGIEDATTPVIGFVRQDVEKESGIIDVGHLKESDYFIAGATLLGQEVNVYKKGTEEKGGTDGKGDILHFKEINGNEITEMLVAIFAKEEDGSNLSLMLVKLDENKKPIRNWRIVKKEFFETLIMQGSLVVEKNG